MLYCKIYTKDNNRTLVIEGNGYKEFSNNATTWQDKISYYPTGGTRFGTVVINQNVMVISPEAKQLLKDIIQKAQKTGDDISCISIHQNQGWFPVCISWIGDIKNEINIDELDKTGFFVGCGDGAPDVKLLDKITMVKNNILSSMSFEEIDKYITAKKKQALEKLKTESQEHRKKFSPMLLKLHNQLEGVCVDLKDITNIQYRTNQNPKNQERYYLISMKDGQKYKIDFTEKNSLLPLLVEYGIEQTSENVL